MKILVSDLPKSNWWGIGMPHYKNNWAMVAGTVPDQKLVENEHQQLIDTLKNVVDVELIPFPRSFDTPEITEHDYVFVRDTFISNQKGEAVLSNFSERHREPEVEIARRMLKKRNIRTYSLSDDAFAEGGEFYYCALEEILFAGLCRNNKKGVDEVTKYLNVKKLCIVETDAFHLDTIFTTLVDKSGKTVAVLTCPAQIKNWTVVEIFLKKHAIQLIEIDQTDTIGRPGHIGRMATNCSSLPGILIGGALFSTPRVEDKIRSMGIERMISPVTQFQLSGGGIHCLTNEIF